MYNIYLQAALLRKLLQTKRVTNYIGPNVFNNEHEISTRTILIPDFMSCVKSVNYVGLDKRMNGHVHTALLRVTYTYIK